MTHHPAERISSTTEAFTALYKLVLYLRGDQGCPWDRDQSLKSMLKCLQEETEELREEIEKEEPGGISEEWGDVFFILLMLAVIAEQTGLFELEKAMRLIEGKMIRRHPHVFGSSDVRAAAAAKAQWEEIKAREKAGRMSSLMDGIPMFYSAAKRADHVQRAAADVGFDWPDRDGVIRKIEEEIGELRAAFAEGNTDAAASELGDVLFSCVNLARFENLDAESLLSKAVDKFINRFRHVESELSRLGRTLAESTLDEMDALWEESKKQDVSQ